MLSFTRLGLTFTLCAVLAVSAAETTSRFTFQNLINKGGTISVPCGRECDSKTFCLKNPNRAFAGFRLIWSDVLVSIKNNDKGEASGCLKVESDDSRFDLRVLSGKSAIERLKEQDQAKTSFLARALSQVANWGRCMKSTTVSPFMESCFKIEKAKEFDGTELEFKFRELRIQYPASVALGIAIIMIAPKLCEQVWFYYLSGITLGVFLSAFLLSHFILKRVIPGRKTPVFAIAAVMQQSLYGAMAFWFDILQGIASDHPNAVFTAIATAILISFALTHYTLRDNTGTGVSGPSAGFRDVVRWSIQLVGYALVLNGSASIQWAITTMIIVVSHLHIRPLMASYFSGFLFWINPNRDVSPMSVKYREYLTEEQWREESVQYTSAQAEKLYDTPQFRRWLLTNADRIQMKPHENDGDDVSLDDD